MVYRHEDNIRAYEQKWFFPFLLKNSSDQVIAFDALYHSAPYKGIYEFWQGMVRPGYQGAWGSEDSLSMAPAMSRPCLVQ